VEWFNVGGEVQCLGGFSVKVVQYRCGSVGEVQCSGGLE